MFTVVMTISDYIVFCIDLIIYIFPFLSACLDCFHMNDCFTSVVSNR